MPTWSNEDKHALSVAHLDVLTYAEAFYLYYDTLRRRSRWLRIPIISLSAITSGASFAFATFPTRWQVYFQVGVGISSLVVTILSGMEGYFRLGALSNQTEKTIIELAALSQETFAMTRMKDEERGPPGDTIKSVYMKLATILNGSAIVPAEFIDKNFDKLSNGVVSMLFAKNESLAYMKKQIDDALTQGTRDPREVLQELRMARMPKLQQWAMHRSENRTTRLGIRSVVDELTNLRKEIHQTNMTFSPLSNRSMTATPVSLEQDVSAEEKPPHTAIPISRQGKSIYSNPDIV